MVKVLIISYHPVPYRNHIFDALEKDPNLKIKVLYWEEPDINRGIDADISLSHTCVYLSKSYMKLLKEILNYDPYLIIISGLASTFAIFSIIVSRLSKKKYAIHSESHDLKDRNVLIKILRDLIYSFLLKKVVLIFPTSSLADTYLKKYLAYEVPSCLFPNSAPFSEINNRINSYRSSLKFSNWNQSLNVLYVGRLVKEKNIEVLLNAWKICESKNPNLNLVIVGDGKQRCFLEKFSNDLNLKNVQFMGRKKYDEIFEYYAKAHLFILPSYEEAYGAVVNEAISAGLPIIISDRVGCRFETLEEGLNGFSFHHLDHTELASKILYVFEDEERWRKMSNKSIEIAKNFETFIISANIKNAILTVCKTV